MAHILSQFVNIEKSRSWPALFTFVANESLILSSHQTTNEGKKLENRLLNRYRDVLPYDSSLVRLDGNKLNYINANLVKYESANRSYILTQGPLSNTVSHFWKMVWQHKCDSIIMLNKLIEKGRPKCYQYFPVECTPERIVIDGLTDEDTAILRLKDAGLTLELESEIHYDFFVKRNLKLNNIDTGETRELCHFNYVDWPDFGEPSCPESFLRFLSLLRNSQVFVNSPVIHCSAGIGRSGTFIFVDIILTLLSESNSVLSQVEPIAILHYLRNQRPGLIQTPDQLRFCYLAILHAFADPNMYIAQKRVAELIEYVSTHTSCTTNQFERQFGHLSRAEDYENVKELNNCSFDTERIISYESGQSCTDDEDQETCRKVIYDIVSDCSNPKEYIIALADETSMKLTVIGSNITKIEFIDGNVTESELSTSEDNDVSQDCADDNYSTVDSSSSDDV